MFGPRLLTTRTLKLYPSSEKACLMFGPRLLTTRIHKLYLLQRRLARGRPQLLHNKDTQALPSSEETCLSWTSVFTQQGHSSFTFFREDLPDMNLPFTQQAHSSSGFFRKGLPDVCTSPSHNKDTQAIPSSGKACLRWTSAFTQHGHSSFTFFRRDLP
jgi:hypothetical protein